MRVFSSLGLSESRIGPAQRRQSDPKRETKTGCFPGHDGASMLRMGGRSLGMLFFAGRGRQIRCRENVRKELSGVWHGTGAFAHFFPTLQGGGRPSAIGMRRDIVVS